MSDCKHNWRHATSLAIATRDFSAMASTECPHCVEERMAVGLKHMTKYAAELMLEKAELMNALAKAEAKIEKLNAKVEKLANCCCKQLGVSDGR
jgi:hypothetical protein